MLFSEEAKRGKLSDFIRSLFVGWVEDVAEGIRVTMLEGGCKVGETGKGRADTVVVLCLNSCLGGRMSRAAVRPGQQEADKLTT